MSQPNRNETLAHWLDAVHARLLWQQNIKNVGTCSAYSINGRVLLVQRHRKDGWEIYVPACDSARIDQTLNAAAQHCGVAFRVLEQDGE